MTIEDCENPYSCSGSPATMNSAYDNATNFPQHPTWPTEGAVKAYDNGVYAAAHTPRRPLIPQSQSNMSLDTNLDTWDNSLEGDDMMLRDEESSHITLHNDDGGDDGRYYRGCCNTTSTNAEEDEEGDDGCIPFDYESEMEECSQYTFSAGPYSLSTSAALAAAATAPSTTSSVTEMSAVRPDTPREASVAPLPCTAPPAPEHVPQSPQWCERQRRDNAAYHAGEHYAWQQAMKHGAASSPDQMRYALRSFVREACCRELQTLRAQPAMSFVRMDAPLSESRTHSSMRASCMLASATSTAQRKARYIQVITEHWKALEARVEEMLAETERESVAASESHLRSIGYALNALALFSHDPTHVIRELNMAHVEEQRRQRHDREAQLLATLETQGRLFLLPTLYAEEVEEPIPVVRIHEPQSSASRSGEFTHPWQLLSPNASIYSLAASSAPGSVGELSPSLSCCTIPSEACTPKWRASTHLLPPSALSSPPLPSHHATAWKDLQPPRLPMLDLFMTAPAVVPSTVIADSESGVPYVMPVDPSYAQREASRQEALAESTLSDALQSPQLSSAHVRHAGVSLPTPIGGRLQPLVLDAAEDSWGSFAEEDMCDYAETMKLSEAEFSVLHFDLRETLASNSSTAAATTNRVTLTDG